MLCLTVHLEELWRPAHIQDNFIATTSLTCFGADKETDWLQRLCALLKKAYDEVCFERMNFLITCRSCPLRIQRTKEGIHQVQSRGMLNGANEV